MKPFFFCSIMISLIVAKAFAGAPVEGTEAQFIFDSLVELKSVQGLENIGECDLDLCTYEVRNVICTKEKMMRAESSEKSNIDLTCWVAPPKDGARSVHVSHDDNVGVSNLRRALIEKTGRLRTTANGNVVSVKSVSCFARGVGKHERESLGAEPHYSCEISF